MGTHTVDGQFQSDKCPACPPGEVPLSVTDPAAQPLLWQYAQIRRHNDAKFADDLEQALRAAGFTPSDVSYGCFDAAEKQATQVARGSYSVRHFNNADGSVSWQVQQVSGAMVFGRAAADFFSTAPAVVLELCATLRHECAVSAMERELRLAEAQEAEEADSDDVSAEALKRFDAACVRSDNARAKLRALGREP